MGDDWGWVNFDADGAREAIKMRAGVLARAVRNIDGSKRASGLEWSVADTVAHLCVVAGTCASYARGQVVADVDVDDISGSNERLLAERPERDLSVLSGELVATMQSFLDSCAGFDAHQVVHWHGFEVPHGALLGATLGELLVHGADICKSLELPWTVDRSVAAHVVRGAFGFAPHVVDTEAAAHRPITYRLRVRAIEPTIWRFDGDGLSIRPASRQRVSCTVATTPERFLPVAYGRESALSAALHGKAASWGRQPLAAFRFASYLRAS